MEPRLIDGKTLAEALGVSPSAVSMAAREERECQGYPIYRWVRRGPGGSARGYEVPYPARMSLGLPPFSSQDNYQGEWTERRSSHSSVEEGGGGPDLDAMVEWLVTAIAAKVVRGVAEEMGPWLKEAIRARLEAGEWPPEVAEGLGKEANRQEGPPGEGEEEEGSQSLTEFLREGPHPSGLSTGKATKRNPNGGNPSGDPPEREEAPAPLGGGRRLSILTSSERGVGGGGSRQGGHSEKGEEGGVPPGEGKGATEENGGPMGKGGGEGQVGFLRSLLEGMVQEGEWEVPTTESGEKRVIWEGTELPPLDRNEWMYARPF